MCLHRQVIHKQAIQMMKTLNVEGEFPLDENPLQVGYTSFYFNFTVMAYYLTKDTKHMVNIVNIKREAKCLSYILLN